jgi:tRNA(Ser,Leu) C12 N-acetylase TAN1
MPDDNLPPEQIPAYFALTRARIKAIEKKAAKRLSITEEEKAAFEQLRSELNNEKLYKKIYSAYINADASLKDIMEEIEKAINGDTTFPTAYKNNL